MFKEGQETQTEVNKMNKYEKLEKDITIALNSTAYIETDAAIPDNRTSNHDVAGIFLPRWNEEKVIEAAQNAGGFAIKCDGISKGFKKAFYIIGFGTRNQGERKSKRAEAITNMLKEMGYETMMYQAMD